MVVLVQASAYVFVDRLGFLKLSSTLGMGTKTDLNEPAALISFVRWSYPGEVKDGSEVDLILRKLLQETEDTYRKLADKNALAEQKTSQVQKSLEEMVQRFRAQEQSNLLLIDDPDYDDTVEL
jgi:hypothetical protein